MLKTERLGLVDIAVRRKSDNKFLGVTNRKYGGWTTPGGKIDEGESHEDAAMRELVEETGLVATLDKLHYVGFFDHKWREFDVRCHGYWCWLEDLEGEQEAKIVEKGTKPFWVERDALLDPESECLAPTYYGWLMAKIGWDHYDD